MTCPATIRTTHGPMLTMPYSVELNDIPMMMIQHHRAEELYDRTIAQFERLYEEADEQGAKVMGLAVHPYISGVPHRIGWFERALDPYGQPAGHAVLAGAADHGLVSEGHSMNFMAKWGLLSQAERDAAYNNSAHVADSPVLNAAREVASSAFRATNRMHLDLRYGMRERNTWDLFPVADPDAPCIVFIHGGYWQRNSKDQFANLIAGPHARGWAAALPGYTLAPDASLTEIVAEINAALDWLGAHGPAHGINGPVVLSGWSAGGHLTAMCLGHPLVQGGPGHLRHF